MGKPDIYPSVKRVSVGAWIKINDADFRDCGMISQSGGSAGLKTRDNEETLQNPPTNRGRYLTRGRQGAVWQSKVRKRSSRLVLERIFG